MDTRDMAHIGDLEPYSYDPAHRAQQDPQLLAVGWLDPSSPFHRGHIEPGIVEKLAKLKRKPVNLTRGFHMCPFCKYERERNAFMYPERAGNGEIRVKGQNGLVYAAPVLICHYVAEHEYRPPDEFLDAVRELALEPVRPVIVAALEREIAPLIKNWSSRAISHQGQNFKFYESDYAVVVCGGIGNEPARRAAEAAVREYSPELLISVGLAGALVSELQVGDTIFPALVVDTSDGSRHQTAVQNAPISSTSLARTILTSYSEIASSDQKRQLAKSYGAHAVDMEAAAVARAAQKHNLQVIVVKSISDDLNFDISELNRFIVGGRFATRSLVFYVLPRPWLWLKIIRLTRNTQLASHNLCAWLRESALTNTIIPGATSPHQS
jgi:nucleoside phosphorylase